MSSSKKNNTAEQQLRVNEKKWSPEVMGAEFTVLPNVLFERQKALGLDPLDINILCLLSTYWWKAEDLPRPAKTTIAEAVGRDASTVRKRIKAMEDLGFIRRVSRRTSLRGSEPNEYDFSGLVEKLKPLAVEKIAERERKAQAKVEKIARRGKPTLSVVKTDD